MANGFTQDQRNTWKSCVAYGLGKARQKAIPKEKKEKTMKAGTRATVP